MTNASPAVPKFDLVLPPSADGASFEMYRAASAPHAQITLPEGARAEEFFVEAANWQLPHALLSRVRASAQLMRRGPDEIAANAVPTMHLYLQIAGEVDALYEGQRQQVGPGDIVFNDSGFGYDNKVTAFDVRVVNTARDRVPPIFLSSGVHGLKLPAEEAGTRPVAAAIETLLREIDGLTVAEADHAVAGLWQVAGGVVETQLARLEQGRTGPDPMLDAAVAFIEARLKDPGLGPESVGAHLGLSRSGLYRLFAPLGGIDTSIRQRRLDASMRAILTEVAPRPTMPALAARHGFSGEGPFVRAFQHRFGTTPAQFRSKLEAGDAVWLQVQAQRAGFASFGAWRAALTSGSPGGIAGREMVGVGDA